MTRLFMHTVKQDDMHLLLAAVALSILLMSSANCGNDNQLLVYYYYNNHFTAPWTVSGTTQVSQYQKDKTRKTKPIWIYWSKT